MKRHFKKQDSIIFNKWVFEVLPFPSLHAFCLEAFVLLSLLLYTHAPADCPNVHLQQTRLSPFHHCHITGSEKRAPEKCTRDLLLLPQPCHMTTQLRPQLQCFGGTNFSSHSSHVHKTEENCPILTPIAMCAYLHRCNKLALMDCSRWNAFESKVYFC